MIDLGSSLITHMELSREFCSRQHTVRTAWKISVNILLGMDGGKEGKLWVLVLSSTQSHMLLHCNNEGVVRDFQGPHQRGCQLLMWNRIWEGPWSLRPAAAPILQPCGYGLLMTSSCLPSVVNWPQPTENWLTAGGYVLPSNTGTTSGHERVIRRSTTQARSLVIYTLWLYCGSQACLVLSPCRSFSHHS